MNPGNLEAPLVRPSSVDKDGVGFTNPFNPSSTYTFPVLPARPIQGKEVSTGSSGESSRMAQDRRRMSKYGVGGGEKEKGYTPRMHAQGKMYCASNLKRLPLAPSAPKSRYPPPPWLLASGSAIPVAHPPVVHPRPAEPATVTTSGGVTEKEGEGKGEAAFIEPVRRRSVFIVPGRRESASETMRGESVVAAGPGRRDSAGEKVRGESVVVAGSRRMSREGSRLSGIGAAPERLAGTKRRISTDKEISRAEDRVASFSLGRETAKKAAREMRRATTIGTIRESWEGASQVDSQFNLLHPSFPQDLNTPQPSQITPRPAESFPESASFSETFPPRPEHTSPIPSYSYDRPLPCPSQQTAFHETSLSPFTFPWQYPPPQAFDQPTLQPPFEFPPVTAFGNPGTQWDTTGSVDTQGWTQGLELEVEAEGMVPPMMGVVDIPWGYASVPEVCPAL